MLAIDLGIFNRDDHIISTKEALTWTMVWITFALIFNVILYFLYDHHVFGLGKNTTGLLAASEFFTGYVIEKSLSLDNIFVIAIIFDYFKVPGRFQHRVLFWGILGALIMRGLMIAAGTALIRNFSWTIYVFGILLLFTAVKMAIKKDTPPDIQNNPLLKLARKIFPVSEDFVGHNFFIRQEHKLYITPLFLVLLLVEGTDVIFAVDSIPAIFGITQDPFIVFTSNICAILGLRALYFVLAGLLTRFHYLQMSLVAVLAYVGLKMLLHSLINIPTWVSLAVIATLLIGGAVLSILKPKKEEN